MNEPMNLAVALDFADNPRPYNTNGESRAALYGALHILAHAYRSEVLLAHIGNAVKQMKEQGWSSPSYRCDISEAAVKGLDRAKIMQECKRMAVHLYVNGAKWS
jgi:hypothetical protein